MGEPSLLQRRRQDVSIPHVAVADCCIQDTAAYTKVVQTYATRVAPHRYPVVYPNTNCFQHGVALRLAKVLGCIGPDDEHSRFCPLACRESSSLVLDSGQSVPVFCPSSEDHFVGGGGANAVCCRKWHCGRCSIVPATTAASAACVRTLLYGHCTDDGIDAHEPHPQLSAVWVRVDSASWFARGVS